ncbi:3,4-dihydroxy-2-butanone-4-phosphate synthase [Candidatus Riesia pediculicola]|uniref:3,4-dihydroxy-2-butanone 4-phosphate synthase n=1 Tax=Riesia pediculicola (strain USDA) TaxID=515618 RepID=D4G8G8_RIEPU|nr:3,4-dihydroxy-2-butanone-4-phosphate synthase [Candidatus Riesia pediculicola]ADD79835.1 3,4-dihydroxy-2-butanone 4-phosphate synthase [Candidatus Riesia pediculicola USDA]ARC53851.1 3,4-dihydroxy-2-butanone 4-phosphate synthase [Candidatus Riesia pediculicola]QOJ86483.1 3,4-dihydroxy-2-butanone-4-phosphate synthase [Candidatus Riesia pediculicola]
MNHISKERSSIKRVKEAIDSLKIGRGVIIMDDFTRENEGDIVFSAEKMTVQQMALTIRHGSGIVCLCINEEKRKQLKLPMMVEENSSVFQTAFTVTIEASEGITTGVSAYDRIITIKRAIQKNSKPEDLRRPGHVFPLVAREGGIFKRRGHTEATVDLMKLCGFESPFGVLCELTNDDGTMSKMSEIILFSKMHGFPLITIDDLSVFISSKRYLL